MFAVGIEREQWHEIGYSLWKKSLSVFHIVSNRFHATGLFLYPLETP